MIYRLSPDLKEVVQQPKPEPNDRHGPVGDLEAMAYGDYLKSLPRFLARGFTEKHLGVDLVEGGNFEFIEISDTESSRLAMPLDVVLPFQPLSEAIPEAVSTEPKEERDNDLMQLTIGRIEVNCFDEDSEMSIRVGKSRHESLTVDEAKQLAEYILYHVKCETESNLVASQSGSEDKTAEDENKTAVALAQESFNKRKSNGETEFAEAVDYIVGFVDGYERSVAMSWVKASERQ